MWSVGVGWPGRVLAVSRGSWGCWGWWWGVFGGCWEGLDGLGWGLRGFGGSWGCFGGSQEGLEVSRGRWGCLDGLGGDLGAARGVPGDSWSPLSITRLSPPIAPSRPITALFSAVAPPLSEAAQSGSWAGPRAFGDQSEPCSAAGTRQFRRKRKQRRKRRWRREDVLPRERHRRVTCLTGGSRARPGRGPGVPSGGPESVPALGDPPGGVPGVPGVGARCPAGGAGWSRWGPGGLGAVMGIPACSWRGWGGPGGILVGSR